MLALRSVAELLDERNSAFTTTVKAELADLSVFPTDSLNWLMVEHYQFSFRNTVFLARAADVAEALSNPGIVLELRRNLAEENGHASMYKAALARIGIRVEDRTTFPPTDYFLFRIASILEDGPSIMLGAMYATETAAIFEHEVFLQISTEVVSRGHFGPEGKPLIAFHEMHLGGVEQSHKDELGIFLQTLAPEAVALNDAGLSGAIALQGGQRAVDTMSQWWRDLLTHVAPPAHSTTTESMNTLEFA